MSPHLFAIYIDDIVTKIARSNDSSKINLVCVSIFMYADDILLLSPSITLLQRLVNLVEAELTSLDMAINSAKSVCLRIGKRFDVLCSSIILSNGNVIPWATSCRYLGVYIQSYRTFKCLFDNAKKSLYRAFNAIYGKIGHCASLDVVFHLINAKCMPSLTFGLNACPVNATERKSLDFTLFKITAKVLGTVSNPIIKECRSAFGLEPMSQKIDKLKIKFLRRYAASDNLICKIFAGSAADEITAIKLQQSVVRN